jgi:hypothetical protein
MEERAFPLKHARHEQANGFGRGQNQAEEDEDLKHANAGHGWPQNFSGRNIAHPRYTSRKTAMMPETT